MPNTLFISTLTSFPVSLDGMAFSSPGFLGNGGSMRPCCVEGRCSITEGEMAMVGEDSWRSELTRLESPFRSGSLVDSARCAAIKAVTTCYSGRAGEQNAQIELQIKTHNGPGVFAV